MTYRTLRQRLLLSAGSTVIMGLFLAAAANTQASATAPQWGAHASSDDASSALDNAENALTAQPSAFQHHFWESLELQPQDAWSILRSSFQWQEKHLSADAQARVDEWIQLYSASPQNIVSITERATPWLAWIAQQVSERGLPGEIALIPFVESSFDPSARSHMGAAGLWQFMPGTGRDFQLTQNMLRDDRRNVLGSTRAALDYLQKLHDMFGDWHLALAAKLDGLRRRGVLVLGSGSNVSSRGAAAISSRQTARILA